MTDFDSIPEPPSSPTPERPATDFEAEAKETSASREAWDEVVRSLDHLGNAVTAWARSATDTEQNRKRAAMLKDQLEGAGRQVGGVIDSATKSEFAQHVGKAASGTGDVLIEAARKLGEDVGPHVAGAFISAAEGIMSIGRKKTDEAEKVAAEAPAPPAASQPSPQPAPYSPGTEPPLPAPHGVPEDDQTP